MDEKNKRNDRYIQFPLCLLQETYNDPRQGLNIILDFGIVNYATKFDYDIIEVGRQLMYAYYRKREMIQDKTYTTLQHYIDNNLLTIDSDYNGFSGSSFDPLTVSEELLGLFKSDQDLRQESIIRYQIAQAERFLKVHDYNINSTIDHFKKGTCIKKSFEQKYGPDCWPSVKPSQVIEFRDSGKDLDLFRAYVGIKSLIGPRNFISTHKSVILSRMMGCKSNDSLNTLIKSHKSAKEIYEKYTGRKRMDNLLFKLMERGFVMVLSKKHESRIYVSVRLKTPALLAEAINQARNHNDLKKQLSEARKLI